MSAEYINNIAGYLAAMELFNKRNGLVAMAALFAILAAAVAASPYDPMGTDLADATTNHIWTRYYSKGAGPT